MRDIFILQGHIIELTLFLTIIVAVASLIVLIRKNRKMTLELKFMSKFILDKNGDQISKYFEKVLSSGENDIKRKVFKIIQLLRSKYKLFLRAVEQSGDCVIITDSKGFIAYVNKTFISKMGYQLEEVINKHSRILKSGIQGQNFYQNMWEIISKGETWSGRIFNRTRCNLLIPFSVKITPIFDNKGVITNYVATQRDISEEIEFERKLLEDKERSEKHSQFKTNFLSTMSHELRTPLNLVCGVADILKTTPLTPKQMEWVKILKTSSNSLLNIINDILDLSKIESGKVILESINYDLHGLLKELLSVFSFHAEQKKIQFSIKNNLPKNMIFKGDPTRLHQILTNLLSNAFKFTSQGYVYLNAELNSRIEVPGNILFMIKDSGIGIAEEKHDLVFQPFIQEDKDVSRKYGGTGLGLSICKELVQKMNGAIWFESKKNSGSTFYVTTQLELIEKNDDIQIDAPKKTEIFSKKVSTLKFLIIEDSAENQLLLKHYIKTVSEFVEVANDGVLGFEKYMSFQPDIVFMDIEMPNLNGLECTQKIREYEINNSIKKCHIIALTGHAFSEFLQKTNNAGCDDYLSKPVEMNKVLEKISHLVEIGFMI